MLWINTISLQNCRSVSLSDKMPDHCLIIRCHGVWKPIRYALSVCSSLTFYTCTWNKIIRSEFMITFKNILRNLLCTIPCMIQIQPYILCCLFEHVITVPVYKQTWLFPVIHPDGSVIASCAILSQIRCGQDIAAHWDSWAVLGMATGKAMQAILGNPDKLWELVVILTQAVHKRSIKVIILTAAGGIKDCLSDNVQCVLCSISQLMRCPICFNVCFGVLQK